MEHSFLSHESYSGFQHTTLVVVHCENVVSATLDWKNAKSSFLGSKISHALSTSNIKTLPYVVFLAKQLSSIGGVTAAVPQKVLHRHISTCSVLVCFAHRPHDSRAWVSHSLLSGLEQYWQPFGSSKAGQQHSFTPKCFVARMIVVCHKGYSMRSKWTINNQMLLCPNVWALSLGSGLRGHHHS